VSKIRIPLDEISCENLEKKITDETSRKSQIFAVFALVIDHYQNVFFSCN